MFNLSDLSEKNLLFYFNILASSDCSTDFRCICAQGSRKEELSGKRNFFFKVLK